MPDSIGRPNFIGKNLIELNSVDSTNQFLSEFSENDFLPEGTLVRALEQTQGRGQKGTEWKAEPGKNLLFSLLLYPDFLLINDQFLLSKIVSISVLKTLKKYLPTNAEIKIKWPNDIYINKFKIAGILIENSIQNSKIRKTVIGVGININQREFPKEFHAISLHEISKKEFDLKIILDEFCSFMEQNLSLLKSSQTKRIDEFYLANLFKKDEWAEYEFKGDTIQAKIIGVDHSGKLQLEDRINRKFSADLKEITFLREP